MPHRIKAHERSREDSTIGKGQFHWAEFRPTFVQFVDRGLHASIDHFLVTSRESLQNALHHLLD